MRRIILILATILAFFSAAILAQPNNRRNNKADDSKQIALRNQFKSEAANFRMSVLYLMQVHDTKLIVNGSQAYRPPVNEEDWKTTMSELAQLDQLCKTKYAGMTNGTPVGEPDDLDQLPATWCEIAARRVEYQTKGRQMAAGDQFNPILKTMAGKIEELIIDPNQYIKEETQLLMYEREKWRAMQTPKFQKRFTEMGVAMPADFFKYVEAKADEFKIINEQKAPTRSFIMPKQKDAAVEAFVRGRYAAQLKGVQILKLGVDDANWVIHRSPLGVPLSQTKVVRALVKIPNRPFCQEHSTAVEKKYKGGAPGAMSVEGNVGSEGLFMKCE